ncbi:hypothetical protein Scep_006409 [Stephania cephalantha]|uniref:Uncharacterized protein n=1 Tax=Stephania cephalantha TaxID=152367 RepID=A0AAP0PKT2_9MAGN
MAILLVGTVATIIVDISVKEAEVMVVGDFVVQTTEATVLPRQAVKSAVPIEDNSAVLALEGCRSGMKEGGKFASGGAVEVVVDLIVVDLAILA